MFIGISNVISGIRTAGLSYIKDNLKLYLDFKSNRSDELKFPSEGSTSFAYADKVTFTQQTFTGAFSVVCWFNGDVNTDYKRLFGDSSPPSGTNDILVKDTNGQVSIRINGSYKANINNVPNNTWSHLAFTRDDNGNIKSYLNGVASGTHTSTDTFTLDNIGGDGGGAVMSMCNAGLWSRELSQEEVQSIMNKSYSQLKGVEKTSLAMWQSLDSTGFGSDLTLGKGSFEDGNGWAVFGSPVTLGYSTTNVYLGSQSLHVTNCANNKGVQLQGQFTIISGEQIYVDAWVYVVDGTKVQMGINSTTDSLFKEFTVTANTWTNITHTYTTNSTGYTYVLFSATDGFDEFYVDNCTAKKVGFNDSTSNNNFGTNVGTTTTTSVYGSNAPILPRAVDVAKEGQADAIGNGSASFNGSSDYVQVADSSIFTGNGGFSVTCWVKFDSISGDTCIVAKHADYGDVDNAGEFYIINDDGACEFVVVDDTNSASKGQIKTGVFAVGTWYHLACTYNGGTPNSSCKIYINGIFQSQSDNATGSGFASINNTTQPLTIGAFADEGEPHDGNISQVGIWQGALTQAQIQSVMESTSYSKIPADVKSTTTEKLPSPDLTSGTGLTISQGSTGTLTHDTTAGTITATDDVQDGYLRWYSAGLEENKLYKLEIVVDSYTGGRFRTTLGWNGTNFYPSVGTNIQYFVGSSTASFGIRIDDGNPAEFVISKISVQEVTNDIVAYYPLDESKHQAPSGVPVFGAVEDATTGENLGLELFTGFTNTDCATFNYNSSTKELTATCDGSSQEVHASISIESGKTYRVEFTTGANYSNTVFLRGFKNDTSLEGNASSPDFNRGYFGTNNTYVFYTRATATGTKYIGFRGSSGNTIHITNFSVKKADSNMGLLL